MIKINAVMTNDRPTLLSKEMSKDHLISEEKSIVFLIIFEQEVCSGEERKMKKVEQRN